MIQERGVSYEIAVAQSKYMQGLLYRNTKVPSENINIESKAIL